ncbi:relaxin-3 receptor 1 [Salminus brasiliensis]|uniref:relaxin-3 receptor 1 n=1 Tax=Salminus brasiliensis TaxID=930266 RepID=UPI003B839B9A
MADKKNTSAGVFNRTSADQVRFGNLEDIDVTADRSPVLRITISIIYSVVCAVGLAGNVLVFFLMRTKRGRRGSSSINFYIFNLALTDCQFVLTLPFWAVDTALDFSWPFGDAMCKIVLSVTVMNMYASVFFLTAMSITRYFSVVSSAQNRRPRTVCSVRWACAVLWCLATVATAPTAIFSAVTNVAGEKLCLLKFPAGQYWLGFYHLQKILLAFVLPMLILSVCYCLLLRFVKRRSMSSCRSRRKLRVTKTVTIMVLSFFLCWMPNQAITLWGVLVKFNVIYWDEAYYTAHTYVFPATVCLAHTNSCLNPFIYCLMRGEFRRKLKSCVMKVAPCLLVSSQPGKTQNAAK